MLLFTTFVLLAIRLLLLWGGDTYGIVALLVTPALITQLCKHSTQAAMEGHDSVVSGRCQWEAARWRVNLLCAMALTVSERDVLGLLGCHQLEECAVDLIHVAKVALQMRAELETLTATTTQCGTGGDMSGRGREGGRQGGAVGGGRQRIGGGESVM